MKQNLTESFFISLSREWALADKEEAICGSIIKIKWIVDTLSF